MIGRFSSLGTYKELFDIRDLFKAGLGGLFALAGFFLNGGGGSTGMVLILVSVAINGLPIVCEAVRGVLRKEVNVDELVSLAIIGSLAAGEYLSAAVVSFVMVVGALVEEATGEAARKAIRTLIEVSPDEATVIENGEEKVKQADRVQVGDTVLVKPGERIAVDGVIASGATAVDESTITGEPIPVEKVEGDDIFAGTLNQNGLIRIRVTRVGGNTTLGKIIELVSRAEAHRPESVSLIDRYAKWFTPAILASAAIAWAATGDPRRAITVLIVGCPCALILAAPTAVVAAISRAARAGILVKGGQYLENAAFADTVLFDKTGTLTQGNPTIHRIVPAPGVESDWLLRQAACVELNSTHPLARAVLKAAHYAGVSIRAAEDLMTVIGLGVRGCVAGCTVEVGSIDMGHGAAALPGPLRRHLADAQAEGATPLLVYQDKKPLGLISVADRIRPEARETLGQLRAMAIGRLGILSGDHEKAVEKVGAAVEATDTWAGLKPEQKLSVIRDLQAQGGKVIFVGDGINDAPALSVADVGIAMGAKGTEVALETADVALMEDDISKIPLLIHLGRRLKTTIKWNIAFGLGFNLLAVIASGGGLLSPIMGAVVHNVGSILVVLSSASLGLTRDIRSLS
jgi:Zn2+/Cd2+-exporting ATPase